MEYLAKYLCDTYPKAFVKFDIDWGVFPDKTPNIFIHNIKDAKDRDILFLASFDGYKRKYMQMAAIYVLTRSHIKSLTLLIPFFDTATMERVDIEGQVATADFDSWMLSKIPRFGPPIDIIVYDLHTLQNRFYFHDGALLTLASGIDIFKEELKKYDGENIAIAFPDDGACKRFGKLFPGYPVIECAKTRDDDKRYVSITSGNPKGYHVFIVDDIVQSGGTLIECKNKLLKSGATKISAYVTHLILPKDSWKKFLPGGCGYGFEIFYGTDTRPHTAEIVDGQGPFKILSIAKNFVKHLLID